MKRVMQEVIQDRKACRNVFEVLDFMCVDYDQYLKSRLITLACNRSSYRNTFGLRVLKVCPGEVDITQHGPSTFSLLQKCDEGDVNVTVEMTTGACSDCELNKFCIHVSTIACMFPESMVRYEACTTWLMYNISIDYFVY